MSRNGSGVYSLPGTYQAVTGETIQAQQHNDPLEDLESDANTARPVVAGGTGATTAAAARTNLAVPGLADNNTFTGNQTVSGTITSSGINTFSKIQKWAKGADVASANALTLGDDGNYFDITGTTAITSIATKGAGTVVKLHFDGALTLTHDATALILPGSGNITTAAGDEAEFVEYATGDWRCLNYQLAGYSPLAATSLHPPLGAFSNLSIKVATNTTITVAADYVTMTNGSSGWQTNAVSSTINLATTGADALDTGTVASATWYAIWAIAKADGTTKCLASTSSSSPTMPSGYTYKARIGWVRTASGSAQLMGTWQFGRRAQYVVGLAQCSALPQAASGSNGSPTATAVGNYVPTATAYSIIGSLACPGAGGAGETLYIAPNASYGTQTSSTNPPPVFFVGNNSGTSGSAAIPFNMVLESTNIYYASSASTGRVLVSGWEDNI